MVKWLKYVTLNHDMNHNETWNQLHHFLATISRFLLTHILIFSGLGSAPNATDPTKTPEWPARPRRQRNKDWRCAEKCGLSNSFFLLLLLLFFIIGINLFSNNKWFSAARVRIELFFFFPSFICLSDINYIFIYRICKNELRNVGEGKVIKN